MRNLLRFLSRPDVFMALVGIIVCLGAVGLWGGMSVPQAKTPPSIASSDTPHGGVRDSAAIARALLSMANLAYEEPFDAHLEDAVKQADFALVQAMLRGNLPLEEAVVEKAELRHSNEGPFHFQRIRLGVGSDSLPFVTDLHESLRAWAENAEIFRAPDDMPGDVVGDAPASAKGNAKDGAAPSGELWVIAIGGIVTHELVLISQPLSTPGTGDGPGRMLRRRSSDGVPRLVIVIDDIGEDMNAARALAGLPYPVTFAVWPRSTHARRAAEVGHAAGLEILIHQPTEPMKYPEMNPGPGALFTSLPEAEIEARVRDSITRVPHAVGMNNHMGSRFTRDRRAAAAMVRPLRNHGFFVLDSMTHPGSVLFEEAARQGIPSLKRDIFLDSVPGRDNVLRQLRKAENIALVTGRAVAIGHPLPDTLAVLRDWESRRDTRIELVRLADLLFAP